MRWRVFSCVLGLLCVAIAGVEYYEYIAMAGFPDGHLTELARAHRLLAFFCVPLEAGFGILFCFLGIRAREETRRRWFWRLLLLFGAFWVAATVLSQIFASTLDAGGGG